MITIANISTRELLKKKNEFFDYDFLEKDQFHTFERVVKNGIIERIEVSHAQLLEELNTREHIPGKKEASLIRRLSAKFKLTAKELREKFPEKFFPSNREKISKVEYTYLANRLFKKSMTERFVISE